MIELGHIRLQHQTSVYEARKKIRGLADALGYDPIVATRLATAVSQATRELLRSSREPRIAVALALETSPLRLVLDFEGRGALPHLVGLAACVHRSSCRILASRRRMHSSPSRAPASRACPARS